MPRPKGSPKTRGSGRKKGARNRATADIKALAQEWGPAAIKTLVELMIGAEYEPTRVQAAKELLDRGYGKAVQPVEGDISHTIRYDVELVFGGAALPEHLRAEAFEPPTQH
jgi:hypothetical protein